MSNFNSIFLTNSANIINSSNFVNNDNVDTDFEFTFDLCHGCSYWQYGYRN